MTHIDLETADMSDTRPAAPQRPRYIRKVVTSPTALVGLAWLAAIAICAIFADVLSPYSPLQNDLRATFQLPSWAHPLGTDQLGRDILSRLMHGAGEALLGSVLAVAVALSIGLPLGLVSCLLYTSPSPRD